MIEFDKFDGQIYWLERQQKLIDWLWCLNRLAVQHNADLDLFDGVHMIAAFDSGITPQDYIINLLFED